MNRLMAMGFCRGCGHALHESAASCFNCGAPQLHARRTQKRKVIAGVLALLLGGLGAHKFYTGAWGWGIVYLVLVWTCLPILAALVEGIRYLTLSQAQFQRKAAQVDGPFAFLW